MAAPKDPLNIGRRIKEGDEKAGARIPAGALRWWHLIIGSKPANAEVLAADDTKPTGLAFVAAGAPGAHDLGGASHTADTLANLNTKVNDATLLKVDDATSDPLIDGEAAADGTEASVARKDHVHPKHHAAVTIADGSHSLATQALSAVAAGAAQIGHVSTGAQTLAGVKTFSSIPVLPASNPTADNEAARKLYVDNQKGKKCLIVVEIDGGGVAITTGIKTDVRIKGFGLTLNSWTLLADQSGSIVIDIWKDSYANYPPTDADTMPGAGKEPTISAATKAEDTTITDWTSYTVTDGDCLRFNVDSCSTITRATLIIEATKS